MLAGLQFEGNCTPKRRGSLVNVLALSTVLQEVITSIFPDVPLHFRTLVHTTVKPARKIKAIKHPQKHRIAILWSRDGSFDTRPGSVYQPNHVVHVLKRSSISMKRSTQATMSMFLKPTKHAKPCVTISCSDLSSDSSQPMAVDTDVPDKLKQRGEVQFQQQYSPSGRTNARFLCWPPTATLRWLPLETRLS